LPGAAVKCLAITFREFEFLNTDTCIGFLRGDTPHIVEALQIIIDGPQ
jgi:hypothetical protein